MGGAERRSSLGELGWDTTFYQILFNVLTSVS